MDNKKFEQLIDLIINENEEQAKALFHDIVVEKSREIYESMMDEDDSMGGQVGDLLDEIGAEETGMTEEEEDLEFDNFDDSGEGSDGMPEDEVIDLDAGDEEGGDDGLEDRVVDLEDKLDQLMAEFEEIMGDDSGEEGSSGDDEEGYSDDEGNYSDDDTEGAADDAAEDEEAMMEAVQLKNVPGLYGSKIGGDDGAQTKSPIGKTANSGQAGMASRPVKFSGDTESVPTGPKSPSNYGTKGETQVKNAGSFKNSPGQDAGKSSFKEKVAGGFGHKTPQGKEAGDGGSVAQNDRSPVAESRRRTTTTKKRI